MQYNSTASVGVCYRRAAFWTCFSKAFKEIETHSILRLTSYESAESGGKLLHSQIDLLLSESVWNRLDLYKDKVNSTLGNLLYTAEFIAQEQKCSLFACLITAKAMQSPLPVQSLKIIIMI